MIFPLSGLARKGEKKGNAKNGIKYFEYNIKKQRFKYLFILIQAVFSGSGKCGKGTVAGYLADYRNG